MSIHEKALKSIFDDMDDFESKKMFGDSDKTMSTGNGFSVTITMSPDQSHEEQEGAEGVNPEEMENLPANHDESMCKGGCAYHTGGTVPKPEEEADAFGTLPGEKESEYKKGEVGMADGGMVPGETDDLKLPPFLRKKKK